MCAASLKNTWKSEWTACRWPPVAMVSGSFVPSRKGNTRGCWSENQTEQPSLWNTFQSNIFAIVLYAKPDLFYCDLVPIEGCWVRWQPIRSESSPLSITCITLCEYVLETLLALAGRNDVALLTATALLARRCILGIACFRACLKFCPLKQYNMKLIPKLVWKNMRATCCNAAQRPMYSSACCQWNMFLFHLKEAFILEERCCYFKSFLNNVFFIS